MEKSEQLNRIIEKLKLLKSKDTKLSNFGAFKHRYIFNKPLTEEQITQFETQFSIQLPAGYKEFLIHVGNGGAGPYYGLESLEDSRFADLDYRDPKVLTSPEKEFPLTEPWNINFEGLSEDDYFKVRDDEYYDPKYTNGLLRLANYGCGVSMNLVVNGKEHGKIWIDDRCNDGGLYSDHYFGNEEKIEFLDWYELWLDDSLSQIK